VSATSGLHVETSGTGPVVVLSHGVGGDTGVWATLAPVLATAFRTVAWDEPGHGRSAPVAPESYGPRLAYDTLGAVVDEATGGDGVILVGHSLGGYLSARYAIDHPDRVRALVLIATGPGFRSPDAREKWNDDVRRQAAKRGRPEQLVGLHEDAHVMDHLAEIACPTLVIVGSEDAAFLGATDYIEKKVAGVERITVAGADHGVPLTHGAELGTVVLDFLARRA